MLGARQQALLLLHHDWAVDGLAAHGLGLQVCFQKSRVPYVGSITMNPRARWLLTAEVYCPAVKEGRGLRSSWPQGCTPPACSQVGSFLPPPASESPRSSLDKRCRLQPLPPSPHVLSSFLPSYKDTGHVGPRAHPVLVDPVSNSDHFLSAWRSERQHVSLLGAIHPRIPGWGPTCQRASHFLSGSTFLQSCPSELVEMPPAPAGDARCGQV